MILRVMANEIKKAQILKSKPEEKFIFFDFIKMVSNCSFLKKRNFYNPRKKYKNSVGKRKNEINQRR